MKPWRGTAVRGCRSWHEGRGHLTARRLPSGCGAGRLNPPMAVVRFEAVTLMVDKRMRWERIDNPG